VRSAKPLEGELTEKEGRTTTRGQVISPNEVRAELTKVLASSFFSTADRMRRFLRLVVEETLEGRGDNLNELLLGMAVYDRDKKFDPRVDSIVRVDAGRLRAKLREFYASDGVGSSIRIEIPKGSYKPMFKRYQDKDIGSAQRLREKDAIATTSLAVLPFVDVSSQKGHVLLADGIVQDLIHRLSCISNFRVASLTSVLALKGRQIDVREMGRELGVESFVEGSVLRAKRRVRVLIRLTDVATGFHTWSEMYAFSSSDPLTLLERISKSIAESLAARLGARTSVRRKKKPSE
jgi:serine/threonine-protein kinase